MSVNFFHTPLAVIGVLGVLGFVSATPAPVAYAETIVVNTTADNANGGDGKCTLREAIQNANADGDTSNGDCTAGNGYEQSGLDEFRNFLYLLIFMHFHGVFLGCQHAI
jgi:CSLREA domain-containing protein